MLFCGTVAVVLKLTGHKMSSFLLELSMDKHTCVVSDECPWIHQPQDLSLLATALSCNHNFQFCSMKRGQWSKCDICTSWFLYHSVMSGGQCLSESCQISNTQATGHRSEHRLGSYFYVYMPFNGPLVSLMFSGLLIKTLQWQSLYYSIECIVGWHCSVAI